MFKPLFTQIAPITNQYCSVHSNAPFVYMCLADNCSEKLICSICVLDHAKSHVSSVHNIQEYLEMLHRNSRNKNNDDLFAQIKCFIDNKEDTLASIVQVQEENERDVLSIFDQLKSEINDTLDIAYHKYCNNLRTYHQRKLQEVQRKIKIISNMFQVQKCIQEKSMAPALNESDMDQFVSLFCKFKNQINSLHIDLAEKFKALSQMVRDEGQLSLELDHKVCERIKGNILDLIKHQFDIADEYKATPSTESEKLSEGTKEKQAIINGKEDEICALVALKGGLVATAGKDSRIKLWELASGECAGELVGHQDTVWSLQAAFDGKYIISSSSDTTIKVWRVSEKKLKKTFNGHEAAVYTLEFEEKSNVLASGAHDGSLILWDMSNGKIKKKLEGHKKEIWSIKKLNESQIISAGEDREIRVWSLRTGGLLERLQGHESCIYDLSVFKGGKGFASCSDDGMIFVWDAEKRKIINSLQAHDKGIRSIAANEDGTLIASGGYDKILRVWDIKKMCLIRENTSNDTVIRCIKFIGESALLYCDTNLKNYKFSRA